MGDWIEAGKKAPDFTLPADDGAIIRKVWKNVQVDGHDEQVLAALAEL